jgi:drug/metabolite transporter (DMT)-like permease
VPVQAFYAGAQRIGAAQASLVSTVEPLWTIAAAAVIYGERLQPIQLVGGTLILVGVVVSQTGHAQLRRRRQRPGMATTEGLAGGHVPAGVTTVDGGTLATGPGDADLETVEEPALPQPVIRLGEE